MKTNKNSKNSYTLKYKKIYMLYIEFSFRKSGLLWINKRDNWIKLKEVG